MFNFENKILTANKIPAWTRISTGCQHIDAITRGGMPVNGVTEVFGESGVGKTQFCLQLSIMVQLPKQFGGLEKGAIYICTEDIFPSKRFQQLSEEFKAKYNVETHFGDHVFVEHIPDYTQLSHFLSKKLPILLDNSKNIGLVVLDSVAGLFRSETESYVNRSEDFTNLSSMLHDICDKYLCAIICINQVRHNVNTNELEPCLGLSWSNNVTCRFSITRYEHSRRFNVVFAPDLPQNSTSFKITAAGITR